MVEKKYLHLNASFFTEEGVEIKQPVAAYEEYGNPEGPVVLLCHGGLSNQHAADVTDVDKAPGWWDKLVGPGNVFDTELFRILSINAIGVLPAPPAPVLSIPIPESPTERTSRISLWPIMPISSSRCLSSSG
ncbi:MAG: hypothetical protein IKS25_03465 [Oscillospiraceae bacterium]|nr:hypothetical protein [Oscillospiraceae bacterium]